MNIAERVKRDESAISCVVCCLGGFRVERVSGVRLQIRTRKSRALLAALALSARPMSRDILADLLWSDRGQVQARASLRQSIFEIQHLGGEPPVLDVRGDEVAVRSELVVTDIELIRDAALAGDWPRLLALMEGCEPGLLTDLDGLDAEFDAWLRSERAHQPSKMWAVVTAAIEQKIDETPSRDALNIVAEILRLDPVNEEATRLALKLDHQLGDSRALHRRFASLRDRLREEYDAAPSKETTELFARLSAGLPGESPQPFAANTPSVRGVAPGAERRSAKLTVTSLLVLVLAVALLMALVTIGRPRVVDGEPILLAVLPFEAQGQAYLAEGIWDDTRAALSRNPSLRVLGRETTAAAAQRKLSPDDYRRRFGVEYVVGGAVRRNGDRVLVSVSLTRTVDGVAIWEDSLRARLGDPFAVQDAIAKGIEGRLRARLARGGGRRADQIVTSAEVYQLYSEARGLLRAREGHHTRRATILLRRAVELDPNFAPAWSSLAQGIVYSSASPTDDSARHEAMSALRRAIVLAPNLAEARATLAIVEHGNSIAAEGALRKAVALDPSYSEAWNWLGSVLHSSFRYREAIEAFERAIENDPLWIPPVHNLVWSASESGDRGAIDRMFRKLAQAGADPILIKTAHAEDLLIRGDYSGSVKQLMSLGRDGSGRLPSAALPGTTDALISLGYADEAARIGGLPSWYGPLVRSERLPPSTLDGKPITAAGFWTSIFFTPHAIRAMVNLGQAAALVRRYRAAFADRDEFISKSRQDSALPYLAPTLSVALNVAGHNREARYILAAAARSSEQALRGAPGERAPAAELALIRAAQGEREQALRLLTLAARRGWLPDGRRQAIDLAQEPGYRELTSDPRFQAVRRSILDHIAQERAELGPLRT